MNAAFSKMFSIPLIVSLSRHQCPSRVPHLPTIHLIVCTGNVQCIPLPLTHTAPQPTTPQPPPPLWCSVAISHHQRAGRRREPAGGIICQGTWAPWESSGKEHIDTKMQKNKDIMQKYYLYHFNQLYRLYQLYHRYISPTNFVRYHWHSRDNCIKKNISPTNYVP